MSPDAGTLLELDRDALALLVDRFYASVRADDLLGPVFEPVLHDRWPAHLARGTVVRFSTGFEDPADLQADLAQALARALPV